MKRFFRSVKEYSVITAGMFIASAGISLFLEPRNIVAGGVVEYPDIYTWNCFSGKQFRY